MGGLTLVLGMISPAPGKLVPVERLVTWEGHWEKGTPGPSSAHVTFELVNRGGKPVQITGTESGCGCAKPQAEADIIHPGETVRVNVSAVPVSTGAKDVPIKVLCDSPATPEIPLTLRIIGTRKPPYLYSVYGDLTFRGPYTRDLVRTLTVTTLETEGEPTRDPEPTSSLAFLTFTLEKESVDPFLSPGTIKRERLYRVGLAEQPAAGTLSGEVAVRDPWDGDLKQQLGVLIDLDNSGARVTPNPVNLSAINRPEITLLVTTNDPVASIDVVQESQAGSGEAGPHALKIEVQPPGDKPTRMHRVKIALANPRAGASGSARLRVRVPVHEEDAIVPVHIISEKN